MSTLLEGLMSNIVKPHEDAFKAVPEDSQRITPTKLRELMPRGTSTKVTDDIMGLIYDMGDSVDMPQNLLEEELMSYMHLIGTIRGIGIKDIINATKYCNLKRNYTNEKAWSIVFPSKYDRLRIENRQIANHVSMYNNSKIVQAIDKELLIPASLQYAPYFHAAVKKQFQLMSGDAGVDKEGDVIKVGAIVMHLAAKELALITKQPEETQLSIKLAPSDEAMGLQQQMNEHVERLVGIQENRLIAGEDIVDVQAINIDFSEIKRMDD